MSGIGQTPTLSETARTYDEAQKAQTAPFARKLMPAQHD